MTNIVLCCVQGMSTGMMVLKMREAAEAMGLECNINAYAIAEVDTVGQDADIILLGPQVRFQADDVRNRCPGKKVVPIDSMAYGMMNGKKVIEDVKKELGL